MSRPREAPSLEDPTMDGTHRGWPSWLSRSFVFRPTGWRRWAKRSVTTVVFCLAAIFAYGRRSELVRAWKMLAHVRVGWLLVATALEVASMVVFARLQRWLLRAGGVQVPLGQMVEITLAGNALSTSLPGGPAWSATWAFGQLRRRGADRVLAGWVILVAGALASFAVFVLVAVGSWMAGSRGPVAQLRWLTVVLAAVPPAIGGGVLAARRSPAVGRSFARAWVGVAHVVPGLAAAGRTVHRVVDRLKTVRPGPRGWSQAFGLALANWIDDAACLAACILALGLRVPWRDLLVIYGLTQVAASLPITPGGLGVVEASMAALLVAYGTNSTDALAVVLLYRIVSFWGLVPVGWGSWFALEMAQRKGRRTRSHPWAEHRHGAAPAAAHPSLGPERVLRPAPCRGCPEGASGDGDSPIRMAGSAQGSG